MLERLVIIKPIITKNNFDLLRLLAAFQVAILHMTTHLKTPLPDQLIVIMEWFPGVPVFFSISGFLIAMSFDRNNSIRKYFWNRFLRIYPALWVCFFVTLLILLAFGLIDKEFANANLYRWSFFQISGYTVGMHVVQKIVFGDFGVGEVNGSLWTIPIELQFYIFLPLLLSDKIKKYRPFILLSVFAVPLFAYNQVLYYWSRQEVNPKILMMYFSFIPHVFSFLLGTLFYLNLNRLRKFVEEKFLIWLIVYVLIRIGYRALGVTDYYTMERNTFLLLFYRVALIFAVMSFAFSFRWLSDKLLKGNDISYGFYIYHMLIVNTFVQLGYVGHYKYILIAFSISIIFGFLSWQLVEKKMLKLKNASLSFVFKNLKRGLYEST